MRSEHGLDIDFAVCVCVCVCVEVVSTFLLLSTDVRWHAERVLGPKEELWRCELWRPSSHTEMRISIDTVIGSLHRFCRQD